MRFPAWKILVVFLLPAQFAMAQEGASMDSVSKTRVLSINPRQYQRNDTVWVISGICKPLYVSMKTGQPLAELLALASNYKRRSLTIHGNVQYDFLFRSFADTPFYQKDFRQHTLRTSMRITVKDNYPMNLNFVIRKSNSPYFKDFIDGGLLFDRLNYYRGIKERMLTKIGTGLPELPYLEAAKKLLEEKLTAYRNLRNRLNAPSLAQRIIEEREKLFYQRLHPAVPGIPGKNKIDSISAELGGIVDEKKRELDSLRESVAALQHKVDSIKNKMAGILSEARKKIAKAGNASELSKIAAEYGLEKVNKKGESLLANLKTIGIGRTILDYSELTARQVSLTGLNIEYSDKIYFAATAGKIDYGFRDFFGKNHSALKQHLLMARVGVGNADRRALIFSMFTGRKANYGSVLSDTVTSSHLVTGYSLEAIIKKDARTSLSAEIAKSTRPVTGRAIGNKELGSLFSFSDNRNLGINVKGNTEIVATQTKLSGLFRKTGEQFQSFSLFSYNTDQTAWMMKAEQPLFKDKLRFTGIVRKNDFVNPFTEKTFRTSTIFTSLQLNASIPKGPSLAIGYYPGTQLYIIDRNRVRENVYYILNGSAVYQYKLLGIRMISSAIFNRYTTKGTDSGFINYSGTNYMLSQSLVARKLQWQSGFSYTDQQELKFYSIENNIDYAIGKMLRINAGVKYNRIVNGRSHWGGMGQLVFDTGIFGNLQLQFERSFLPTIQQTLFPVEAGRLIWIKNF